MAITPDGKIYVANGRSNSVSVIDTETNQKITDVGRRIAVGVVTGNDAGGQSYAR
jgi:YVTN family beta-propeller protein